MGAESCLAYLQERTTLRPGYADAWNKYGLALARLGKVEEALAAFDQALAINADYHEAEVNRCFALAESGDTPGAFRAFRNVCHRRPDEFATVFPLGVFCLRFGWPRTGVDQLLRAASMRPHVPYVLAATAAALVEAGDPGGAETRLARARAALRSLPVEDLSSTADDFPDLDAWRRWDNPNLARMHHHASRFHTCRGSISRAVDELLEGNRRFPGDPFLMVSMGKTLLAREDRDGAARWLAAAIQIDRSCHHAHFELGFVHAEAGRLEEALRSVMTAVRLRPMYPDYRYHLGALLMDAGRIDEAIDQLQRLLVLDPSFGHGALRLASAYLEKNLSEKTLDVLGTSPCANWPEGLILAARAYLQRGRTLNAQRMLEKVLEVDDSNGEAIAALRELQGHHSA